jgi:NAD(P)-dependent dehydrogenase (short-subunit alcohol dehydrogenase family)
MKDRLEGRVAVITGEASGIGLADGLSCSSRREQRSSCPRSDASIKEDRTQDHQPVMHQSLPRRRSLTDGIS